MYQQCTSSTYDVLSPPYGVDGEFVRKVLQER